MGAVRFSWDDPLTFLPHETVALSTIKALLCCIILWLRDSARAKKIPITVPNQQGDQMQEDVWQQRERTRQISLSEQRHREDRIKQNVRSHVCAARIACDCPECQPVLYWSDACSAAYHHKSEVAIVDGGLPSLTSSQAELYGGGYAVLPLVEATISSFSRSQTCMHSFQTEALERFRRLVREDGLMEKLNSNDESKLPDQASMQTLIKIFNDIL
ncbi:hypothetical protein BU23DRAFT_179019 [Bimuria novae-zelandiae CBS 107.79]|uniref:Uncharacterized protein n=1 Tax=Bimuria novae-zelandiae CBS 107.79 TaxID=1447943 RepID=A0A6A5V4V8_9PLEO|nr:hypothetical protein BU23DRAFT_179019 [Bimuria novae-zelandiae CBS 107.79]